MHPADVVGAAFPDPLHVAVVQPLGDDAAFRPFVRCPLGIAAEPDGPAVDQDAPVFVVARLPEAGFGFPGVDDGAVRFQADFHPVL